VYVMRKRQVLSSYCMRQGPLGLRAATILTAERPLGRALTRRGASHRLPPRGVGVERMKVVPSRGW